MTIEKLLHIRLPYRRERSADGIYGIEVELEHVPPLPDATYTTLRGVGWNMTEDGSLVDGIEFVSKATSYKDLQTLLTTLDQHMASLKVPVTQGSRTSVHVHVDVTQLTHTQVKNFVQGFFVLEDFFFSFANPIRKYNNFCAPLRANSKEVIDFLKDKELSRDRQVGAKYRSLNIASLWKYGTLEARLLHGTYKPEDILAFVEALHLLKSYIMMHNYLYSASDLWELVNYMSAKYNTINSGSVTEGIALLSAIFCKNKYRSCEVDNFFNITDRFIQSNLAK